MTEPTLHTPGRIRFYENGEANSYALLEVDADDRWLLTLLHNGLDVTERQRENIRRLAACWNASVGVSTELLEAGPIVKIAGVMAKNISDKTRDELLDALQTLVDMDIAYQRGPKVSEAVENARAVIARATEDKEGDEE